MMLGLGEQGVKTMNEWVCGVIRQGIKRSGRVLDIFFSFLMSMIIVRQRY